MNEIKKLIPLFPLFILAIGVFLFSSPLPALGFNCSSSASLAVTSSKTSYEVGEPFSGEIVFTNKLGPIDINFDVKAVKSGQTLISKNYTLTTQFDRNVYQLKDALGVSSLPEAGVYVVTVVASYPPLVSFGCSWNANLTLTATSPAPVAPPQIQQLIPDSRLPGEQVIIKGSNFTPTGNDVKSGTTVVASNLPSAGGDTIVFTVPNTAPGQYPISVSNRRGTSNEVSFTVLAPAPVKLLTSLNILPTIYFLGQTVTGSVILTNPTTKEIKANFSIELYKDTTLFWQRQIKGLSIPPSLGAAPKVVAYTLDDVFGFKPTIPDNPSFVGNWKLVIRRTDTPQIDDSVSQTFVIKAPIVQPLTLTFNFDPKEYILGDTLKGKGAVVNPGSLPVKTDFKIELFQETTLKWQREIKGISVPAGTANFTVDDLFGFKVVIPNEIALIGDWKLKIAQMGTTPPVTVEATFKIQSLTAACKPTTGTPESGVFGMHINIWPSDNPKDIEKMRQYLKELNVKLVRFDFVWSYIEPQKGKFDWGFYDNVVSALHKDGIKILAIINFAPEWAGGGGITPARPPAREHMQDYANFASELVKRYKPEGVFSKEKGWADNYGISHWEIWNEANSGASWAPRPNIDDYVAMLALANIAMRQADSNAVILHAGFLPSAWDKDIPYEEFLKGMYQRGAKNCFDVLAVHPYSGSDSPRKSFEKFVPELREIASRYGDINKPLWFTEFGYWTRGNPEYERLHAQYVAETHKIFKEFASVITFTTLRDFSSDPQDSLGLLRRDFSKKPAFDVLKNLLNPTTPPTAACKPTTGTPASKAFGIVQGFFPWSTSPKDLDYMKELGIKWARLELRWDYIEPQKGQFNWEFYDKVVKAFEENDIQILGQLQAAPCWANGRPCPFQNPLEVWYPPTDSDAWANFNKKAVERYKPGGTLGLKTGITHWEIWNEPNALPFWQPTPDVAKYVQMLAVSNKAIREADPKAIIVGASIAGVDPIFTDAIYKADAKNCFDVISFHPYGSVQNLKLVTPLIKKFLIDHQDANKPIWYTEYGFETGAGKGTTEAQQAEYLRQTYDLFSQGLVPAFFWIALRDEAPPADFTWGVLRSDYSKKPAFDVLKSLLNPPKGPVSITIRGDQDIGDVKLMQGFLVGVGWNYPPDELVTKLKPKFWRVDDTWDLNVYKYARKFGPRITFILNNELGAKPWENWKAFEQKIKDTVKASRDTKLPVDYWDIWNEPDGPLSGTPEQICEMFKRGHNAIRSVDPTAKIVGPSISSFNNVYLSKFLDCLAENNLRFDAISWHEFGLVVSSPENIPRHTQQIRDLIKSKPQLGNPEIHINEYADPSLHLIPGWNVGGLYYFEKANLDWVSRACWWKMPYDERTSWNECGSGLDGLFIPNNFPNPGDIDGKTPEPLYWVHRAYADMAGKRIVSDSSNPKVVALASKDDTTKEIHLLVGRYDQTASNVEIKIQNYPYSATVNEVQVEIKRIPSQGNIHSKLTEPIIVGTKILPVVNGAVTININNFQDGDAYIIIVKSQLSAPGISINVDAATTGRNIAELKRGHNFEEMDHKPYNLQLYEKEIGYGNALVRVHSGMFLRDDKEKMRWVIEQLLKIGKPDLMFDILGMPKRLASKYTEEPDRFGCLAAWATTPPKDYNQWKEYVKGWVNTLKPYNIKYWEIWNEPADTQSPGCFWSGTEAEYFQLYKATVEAIREAYGGAIPVGVKIGGAAEVGFGSKMYGSSEYLFVSLPRFLGQNNLPLDFFSWHKYDQNPLTLKQNDVVAQVKAELRKNGFSKTELIIDEYTLGSKDFKHATVLAGEFIQMAQQGIDRQSVFTFYDKPWEPDFSWGQNLFKWAGLFGMADNLITKASYNFFKAINKMGDTLISVDSQPSATSDYVLATKSSDKVSVMIVNFQDAKVSDVKLNIKNVPTSFTRYTKYIIDTTHSNAWAVENRIKTRMERGKTQAVSQAKEAFKTSLRQKGYSEFIIAVVSNYFDKYIADNNDPDVKKWLEQLTPRLKQDVLDAFTQAMSAYNAKLESVADEINNWPEVKLYSEAKTIAVPGGTYGETLALEPYAVQVILLSK